MSKASALFIVGFVVMLSAVHASAQTSELVGVRAQGMAGAFTAVADDATATWWNPAGLAGGAYFSAILEYDRPRTPPDDTIGGFSAGFPALGLSYYRLPLGQVRPATSTALPPGSRQDGGVLSVYGASVGQSLGNHLVVGSTLKLAHAAGDTEGGLDVGVMATFGHVRAGLMVRNARELDFSDETADAWQLQRQFRAGAALTTGSRGVIGSATVAFDADLTRTQTPRGEDRRMAAGGEVWTSRRVLAVRGGFSASTVGERRSSLSGGASVSVRRGTYLDAHVSRGAAGSDGPGWGLALRLTF